MATTMKDPMERFEGLRTVLPNGCHEWVGGKSSDGYGRFRLGGRGSALVPAHRWIWEQTNGPVANHLVMDHYRFPYDGCIGPSCVNAQHVKPVTRRVNRLRARDHDWKLVSV